MCSSVARKSSETCSSSPLFWISMPSLQKTMKVESWFWQFILVYKYWKNSLACLSGFFFCINFDLLSRWQDIGTNHQSIPRKWRKIRPLTCLRLRQAETEMGRCMHWWSLMSYILQCVSLCKYSNITAYYILYNCLILVWANLYVALCYWPACQIPEISGCTPLHWAAHNGLCRDVELLLGSGGEWNLAGGCFATEGHWS